MSNTGPVRRYPHWLDPEVYVARWAGVDVEARVAAAELRLKVAALLDTPLILSDVQPFEARALVRLFSEDGFLPFLEAHPDFLALRVPLDGEDRGRFWRATRGLRRARQTHWRSSVTTRETVVDLIDALERDAGVDLASPGPAVWKVLQRWPAYEGELRATLTAVYYFGVDRKSIVLPASTTSGSSGPTYYGELAALAARVDLPAASQLAREAMTFVDGLEGLDGPEKLLRSRVLESLDFGRQDHRRIWLSIGDAWNRAAEGTVQADGGSSVYGIGDLGASYHQDDVADLVWIGREDPSGRLRAMIPTVTRPFDIGALNWRQISDLRGETSNERRALAEARHCSDVASVREALEQLFAAYARVSLPWHIATDAIGVKVFVALMTVGGPIALYLDPSVQSGLTFALQTFAGGGLAQVISTGLRRRAMIATLRRASAAETPTDIQERRFIPRIGRG